ncbi:MAG: phosphoribosylaminoimidazolecarboxamide formyltransferase [Fibrobacterota bacterium]
MELRYGCNPHQKPASISMKTDGALPFRVLNGSPGYINFCDALNAWQLVRELHSVTALPAAASFKHVSPAGAAVYTGEMSSRQKQALFVDDLTLSPLASAYAKARGADRMSSFGDWIALSQTCDKSTAMVIRREVSDGVIAPGYTDEARDILSAKRKGKYNVIEIDPSYEAPETEKREIFGITLEQKRNTALPDDSWFSHIVTEKKELPQSIQRDMSISQIVLKYTQSNSVVYVYDGQVIGIGAGQQSRVHCTRLAGEKADKWFLRHTDAVLSLDFKDDIKRAGKNNAIDQYLEEDLSPAEIHDWKNNFNTLPAPLSQEQKRKVLDAQSDVVLGSDAFFPFRDNIDRASRSGVDYIIQPGGSMRDDVVIDACNEYGMTMCFTGVRLFHH